MESFVITKRSILDVAAALDPPLPTHEKLFVAMVLKWMFSAIG